MGPKEHLHIRKVQTAKWPDPDAGPYLLKVWWQQARGQYECIGVWVGSFDPFDRSWDAAAEVDCWETPPRVTAALLRKVPVASLRDRHYRARERAFERARPEVPLVAEMAEISKEQTPISAGLWIPMRTPRT